MWLWTASLAVAALLALFAATRLLVRRAERRFPAQGRWITVQGVRVHVLERGAGPPLVLLHGAFGSAQDFAATVLEEAARHYRVIAVDRPGHGYSQRGRRPMGTPQEQARLLHDTLRALGVQRPVLAGFSWGGSLALAYALAYPEDTAAVVLLAGASHPWPTPTSQLYVLPTVPVLGTLALHTVVMPLGLRLAWASMVNVCVPRTVPAPFARSPVPLSLRPHSFAANAQDIRQLKEALRLQCRGYGELTMPVEILHGDRDRVVGLKIHARALHAQVPGSALTVLADCGHQLLYCEPGQVLAAIHRAFARVQPGAEAAPELAPAPPPRAAD